MRNAAVTLRTGRTAVFALVHTYGAHGCGMAAQAVVIHDVPTVIGDLDVDGIVVEHLMKRVVHSRLSFFKVVDDDVVVRQMTLHTGNLLVRGHGVRRGLMLHRMTHAAECGRCRRFVHEHPAGNDNERQYKSAADAAQRVPFQKLL